MSYREEASSDIAFWPLEFAVHEANLEKGQIVNSCNMWQLKRTLVLNSNITRLYDSSTARKAVGLT